MVDATPVHAWLVAQTRRRLGRGDEPREALALAARAGAMVVTGRGPYGRQLRAEEVA